MRLTKNNGEENPDLYTEEEYNTIVKNLLKVARPFPRPGHLRQQANSITKRELESNIQELGEQLLIFTSYTPEDIKHEYDFLIIIAPSDSEDYDKMLVFMANIYAYLYKNNRNVYMNYSHANDEDGDELWAYLLKSRDFKKIYDLIKDDLVANIDDEELF